MDTSYLKPAAGNNEDSEAGANTGNGTNTLGRSDEEGQAGSVIVNEVRMPDGKVASSPVDMFFNAQSIKGAVPTGTRKP